MSIEFIKYIDLIKIDKGTRNLIRNDFLPILKNTLH